MKQHRRGAACVATVATAALGLAGCAPDHVKPAAMTPAPQHSTSAPQAFQHRSYACGSDVAPPLAASVPGDPVRLSITRTRLADDRITALYEISSSHPEEVLTYPVSPTPPTILLTHAGHIAGRQKPPDNDPVDGRAAEGRPIGLHPYVASLDVDQLCPGTDWSQVHSHPGQYRVEILMSRQPTGGPQTGPPATYLADPLTTVSVPLS